MHSRLKKVVMLGPPGSGKGTFAKRLAPRLKLLHLSAGDALRAEVKKKSEIGKFASEFLCQGQLVPSEAVTQIMFSVVSRTFAASSRLEGYLLDGFPRTAEQAEFWWELCGCDPDLVVNVQLDKEVLVTKLAARRVCAECGDNYNLADIRFGPYNMPPLLPKKEGICDTCGSSELVQRSDDTDEVIRSRLELHAKIERNLLEYYRSRGKVVDFPVFTGVKQTEDLLKIIQTYMPATRM